ncbi:MAG: DNA replication/repair protein RecF [Clostridia bacterium]|nr:DNA replication/repair protein RecF [Clostridia bacterium]
MYIKEVYLKNFRNYKEQIINLNENANVFYGNNAQGKTNILEALYFAALGRSFRTYKESELINFNNEYSNILITYVKDNKENKIEISLNKKNSKIIKVNGIKINKNSELVGNINLVIFSPDDITILKQGPQQRRKFLDVLISQLKPKYMFELTEYNKILESRNASLKNRSIETLDIWNEQLASKMEIIHKYRKEYIDKIQEKLKVIHPGLTNNKEEITIIYKTNFKDKESFLELLKKNEQNDLFKGFTTEGAHREDFEILINNKSLNLYGSQGQHRTAILSLKIAELKIIKEEIEENPVLLLDDVTSELDEQRVLSIFDVVKDYQILITCTDLAQILKYDCLTKNIKLFNINSGNILE